MSQGFARTAEHVSAGHPDKFCDQVADTILDEVLRQAAELDREEPPAKPEAAVLPAVRTAIECLVKDNLLIVSGEVKLPPAIRGELDIVKLARGVWKDVGYSDIWAGGYADEDKEQAQGELTVINHLRAQSPNIGKGHGKTVVADKIVATGADDGGAGDQGVMVGYATDETEEMMPQEWVFARNLCRNLHDLRISGALPWLLSDCKTQVSLAADGSVTSVIIAAQHSKAIDARDRKQEILEQSVWPVLKQEISKEMVTINGTGRFVIGGPTGDAGVVGRKIVVDAYGPRVPVGGGAYSGKDPSKVDRSAAYMCRHIAKAVVQHKVQGARECTVSLAYGIGKHQPEMLTAITDRGEDVSTWVWEKFKDLSPKGIIERLGLRSPNGWSYYETASYGHYGRDIFPWEKPAQI
ncbi:MAG TPA: methionine adenosyltransferase [Thermoanaerobaculia bacterium]|nr:methionine adenosyltransferase [Thermoanaerobaculia bacterium]